MGKDTASEFILDNFELEDRLAVVLIDRRSSDYDLMVVVPDSTPVSLRDSGRAYKAIWRLGVATDVLVWTHSDFEERLQLKASLPSTIVREGKLLYAA